MTSIAINPTALTDWLDRFHGISARLVTGSVASKSVTVDTTVADLLGEIDAAATGAAEANWDGEGGQPVEPTTVRYAHCLARLLPLGIQKPEVSVDRDGDLSFEWYFGPRRVFSVSVRRDGVLHYAGLFGPHRSHGSEVLYSALPTPIALGIRRAATGE